MNRFLNEMIFKMKKMFSIKADELERENLIYHVKNEMSQLNATLNADVRKVAEFSLKIENIVELIKTKKKSLLQKENEYKVLISTIKTSSNDASKIELLKADALTLLKNIEFIKDNIAEFENLHQNYVKEYENMVNMLKCVKQRIIDKELEAEKAMTSYELLKLKKSIDNNFKLDSVEMCQRSYLKKLNDEIKTENTVDDINEKIGNKSETIIQCETKVDSEELKQKLENDLK